MRKHFLLWAFLGLTLIGCDSINPAPSTIDRQVVVESYQIASEPLAPVRLSYTLGVNEVYEVGAQAVRNASVTVYELTEARDTVATYAYIEVDNGRYIAPDPNILVKPGTRYALRANVEGARISAETFVPGDFVQVTAGPDSVFYQDIEPYASNVTRSFTPARQSAYVFSVEAMVIDTAALTPFYKASLGDDPSEKDLEEALERFALVSSPIVNEGNYEENADGSITIRLPWFAIAFYGSNKITTTAIDENLYDYFRSSAVQQGGTTLSPGEIPNVLENVEGGIGFFGSMTRLADTVYVKRPIIDFSFN
jgi:hypothetical protein